MFVINFSPNAVIPYVGLAQLSELGWELRSGRKGGWPQIQHNLGSSHPANSSLCRLRLRCHLLWGPLFLCLLLKLSPPEALCHLIFTSFVMLDFSSPSLEGGDVFSFSLSLLRCQTQSQVQVWSLGNHSEMNRTAKDDLP